MVKLTLMIDFNLLNNISSHVPIPKVNRSEVSENQSRIRHFYLKNN